MLSTAGLKSRDVSCGIKIGGHDEAVPTLRLRPWKRWYQFAHENRWAQKDRAHPTPCTFPGKATQIHQAKKTQEHKKPQHHPWDR